MENARVGLTVGINVGRVSSLLPDILDIPSSYIYFPDVVAGIYTTYIYILYPFGTFSATPLIDLPGW
jgi:hypothetical protein